MSPKSGMMRVVAPFVALLVLGAGCGDGDPTPGPEPAVRVVTSTVVIADLARNVGGDAVRVESLVPSGGDVHTFRATPSDGVKIGEADLILLNGTGLDDFLSNIVTSAKREETEVVEVSKSLSPIQLVVRDVGERGDDDENGDDPHFWLDPIAVMTYVEEIRDALREADPQRAAEYDRNAIAYIRRLQNLDRDIRAALAPVPLEHRVLITFHDAFAYFGARYEFEVIAFLGVEGGEPTPRDIVRAIEEVEEKGLPAIFAEPQFAEDALRSAAEETSVDVGTLRSSTFDDASPDYISMMRANAREIAELLR